MERLLARRTDGSDPVIALRAEIGGAEHLPFNDPLPMTYLFQ
jgi:hypothetical protein